MVTQNRTVFDREAFASRALRFRETGEREIRDRGIEVDEILAQELASPGSDLRNGISIVARPAPQVIAEIERIQRHLLVLEPQQFAVPAPNLHLTVLEIAFSRTRAEVDTLLGPLWRALPEIVSGVPEPVLDAFVLGFDPKGCALNFLPQNGDFERLRGLIRTRLEQAGIPAQARYAATSAHVSIFRYLAPLLSEKNQWADHLKDTPVDRGVRWKIAGLTVTFGANWYGKSASCPGGCAVS